MQEPTDGTQERMDDMQEPTDDMQEPTDDMQEPTDGTKGQNESRHHCRELAGRMRNWPSRSK
jgi:hypothetical protein